MFFFMKIRLILTESWQFEHRQIKQWSEHNFLKSFLVSDKVEFSDTLCPVKGCMEASKMSYRHNLLSTFFLYRDGGDVGMGSELGICLMMK